MISVIIPAYNAEKTIRHCLESVLEQGASVELILADDGSTDGTRHIAKTYGKNVQVLVLSHGGVSAARNAGLDAANGEWVMFLDADDALLPGALSEMERHMTGDTDAVCGTICRGNHNHKAGGKARTYPAGHELIDYVLADPTNYLTIHAWAFRRKKEMPQFNPDLRIGEDSDWVLRYLYTARNAVFISFPVYRYTVSADSTIHKWREGQERDFLKMLTMLSQGPAGKEKNWPVFVLINYLLVMTHVVFHPGNPENKKRQYQAAKILRDHPIFAEAFDKADLHSVSRTKRIVLVCMKRNWTVPAYMAVKIRQKQNARHAIH